uniref:Uncharacterized protein n=1 Tax=viral metagenome TaxID=1070528 RepID=A0A6H1Z9V7_9ZZZZ
MHGMGKHTPGPWHYRQIFDLKKSWYDYTKITAENGDTTIAVIPPSSIEEDEIIARLIAAAPELLEALKETLSTERSDCNDRNCGLCTRCKSIMAIAKAEGRD